MVQVLESVFYRGDEQNRTDYTPGSALTTGKVVDLGGRIGCVTSPQGIAASTLGSIAQAGVFKLKKAVGTGVTFAKQAPVYWHTTNLTAVAAAGADIIYAGLADEAAVTGDDHVKTEINALDPQAVQALVDA